MTVWAFFWSVKFPMKVPFWVSTFQPSSLTFFFFCSL